MNGDDFRPVLAAALRGWATHEETLRELDAALGDGDLGITVRSGALAAAAAVDAVPVDAGLGAVLAAAGRAFATANPSTFAALVGGGVMAGAKELPDQAGYGRDEAVAFGRAVEQRIQQRGKAELGDKTLLDALHPTLEVLAGADGDAAQLCRMIAAVAHDRVAETAHWESKRGRAGWLGERSIDKPDAGSSAYALFLDELATALEACS